MKLVLVETMDQVLERALRRRSRQAPPEPIVDGRRRLGRGAERPQARSAGGFPAAEQPPAVVAPPEPATESTAGPGGPGRPVPRQERAMEYRDYYATLGVPRTRHQADIKKAFRKLARKHHPDVNKGDAGGRGALQGGQRGQRGPV